MKIQVTIDTKAGPNPTEVLYDGVKQEDVRAIELSINRGKVAFSANRIEPGTAEQEAYPFVEILGEDGQLKKSQPAAAAAV